MLIGLFCLGVLFLLLLINGLASVHFGYNKTSILSQFMLSLLSLFVGIVALYGFILTEALLEVNLGFTEFDVLGVVFLVVFIFGSSLGSKYYVLFANNKMSISKSVPVGVVLFSRFELLGKYVLDRLYEKDRYYLYGVYEGSVVCIRVDSITEVEKLRDVTSNGISDSKMPDRYSCTRCGRGLNNAPFLDYDVSVTGFCPDDVIPFTPETIVCCSCLNEFFTSEQLTIDDEIQDELLVRNI